MGVFAPSAFLRDAALAAAHDLGLFAALSQPRTASDLAATLGVPAGHRLRAFLDALAALGVLQRDCDAFTCSAPPPRPDVPRAGWGLLAEVLRRDRPLPDDPTATLRYHRHLLEAGAPAAREVAALLESSPAELLDLGGGAGAYTAAFLDAHPTARAVLVDAPEVVSLARDHLAQFGERVRFVEGDARAQGACFDAPRHIIYRDARSEPGAALLANVLHLHPPETCAELCAAAARAVAPGGLVAVVDLRMDEDRSGPLEGVLFALNMAVYTDGGDVYPASQIRAWLEAAGLESIEVRPLAAAPEAMVVLGRRPASRRAETAIFDEPAAAAGEAAILDEPAAAGEAAIFGEPAAAGETAIRDEPTAAAGEAAIFDELKAAAGEPAIFDELKAAAGEAAILDEPAAAGEAAILDELGAAVAAAGEAAFGELAAAGALRNEAIAAGSPRLSLSVPLGRALARAIALERAERDRAGEGGASLEREAALVRHYTDVMPRARVALLASRDGPAAPFFHTPLDWTRLPRLDAALDRLYALLEAAGAPAEPALGAPTVAAFRARTATLAQLYERTHYAGSMPLLYGNAAELAYFHARAAEENLDLHGAIDRFLTAPLVHELCHFAPSREALAPLHLDECVAGWLGVYVHPEFAYPAPTRDDAIFAAPWLAQIGQAISRAFTVHAVVRAHAGAAAWTDALPRAFVDAAARLGWEDWRARRTLHFLSDTLDPDPWVGLALAAGANLPLSNLSLEALSRLPASALESLPLDPAFDRAIAEDALRAMCLEDLRVAGTFRTRTQLPAGPLTIDAFAGRISTLRAADPPPVLPVAPRYWLPPAICARLRAAGGPHWSLRLHSLDALPLAAEALATGNAVEDSGFSLRPAPFHE